MQQQNEGNNINLNHNIDTYNNQDKVLKESFSLFKGGSLDFLDAELHGEVTEVLNTEITETTTKKAYGDNALKLSTNKGVHTEWEADISKDDMMRFASYHIDFSRMHKIPFTTVIITIKKPSVTSYTSPSMTFTPKIINLKERDADMELSGIKKKLKAGEHINELLLIYLPLYGSESGKTTVELLDTAIKLTPEVAKDDMVKLDKLQSLMILLNSTFVSEKELEQILEANSMVLENNRAVRVIKDMGRKQGILQGIEQGIEQTAINMLQEGEDFAKISKFTRLDTAKLMELQSKLQI